MTGKFEVYQDMRGKHRFRLKTSGGTVIAVGEAFDTRAAAKAGCEQVSAAADGATIEEVAE